ncbi:mannonate dehydratase [Salipiger sp. 1_MG-2023]|uniref:mannonate dehydratase n=1 Tax=Salipiger sp. 1_MG-2023 TaxID=3062665 RepID=UPI0026E4467C|nr:mannonate dehydratase [Salipiger sp. 1_MG-2023]MDO6585103.1 mannonate dehydratase [Salipiger sp. 1_MG-2023]
MQQTWRWFGPNDPVSIDDIRQAGVEGIVSALHQIAPGALWQPEDIAQRQADVAQLHDGSPSGLRWDVVESLPVSEDIKRQTGDWRAHLDTYKQSLRNLAQAGIEVVCYNFMPLIDWTRTDLAHRLPGGATCMRFDLVDFACFDIHILQRPGAAESFAEDVVAEAERRHAGMTDADKVALTGNIVSGLPGAAEHLTLDDLRARLAVYANIAPERLRAHMADFIAEIAPVAQDLNLRLCCHPDDPPFPLLGLPRIMSTEADYRALRDMADLPANGITLCSGSLGARHDNDLPGMMDRLGDHVHFLHLRNVRIEGDAAVNSFHEAEHLGGGTDMVALVAAVLRQERKRREAGRADWSIPFRPDHGQNILDDLTRRTQPGYPAIGRLKGLAELRGIITALSHPQEGTIQ